MKTLIIMVGLPGSGKSTYAKETLLDLHPDWEYVSRDEVRYEYVTDQEHYFDHESEVYKEFINRLEMHLLNEKTVIADATHISVGSRRKLIYNLKVKPDKIIAVVMMTPFDETMRRNATREGITRVPDDLMYRMKNRYQKPNPHIEPFDQVVYIKG